MLNGTLEGKSVDMRVDLSAVTQAGTALLRKKINVQRATGQTSFLILLQALTAQESA